jgi:DNA-binding NarL/FixJ family response regulator
MIKICVADNHPVVIQGIKSYFETNTHIDVVASATNLENLVNLLQDKIIDIVVLDLDLHGISSIRDIKGLVKDFSDSKIILFTAVSEKMYAPTAVKAGVSSYVMKLKSEL